MSEVYRIKKDSLKSIGDALRAASFTDKTYGPSQMAEEITNQTSLRTSILERTITSYNDEIATKISHSVFRGCSLLKNIRITQAWAMGEYCFASCAQLEKVDLHKATHIYSGVFHSDTELQTLIIRSPAVCTLAYTTAFTGSGVANGTGYIYVPAALIEDYKAATNWSLYADQFRAIEDYPEITGG